MSHRYEHLRSWKPGVSGNPFGAGRYKLQLAAQIRQISHDGREMVDLLFSVIRGEALPLPGKNGRNGRGNGKPPRPSPELRVRAAEILLDRAFGKAKEILELEGEGSEDEQRRRGRAMIAQLSVEERAQLRTLLETARERAERRRDSSVASILTAGRRRARGRRTACRLREPRGGCWPAGGWHCSWRAVPSPCRTATARARTPAATAGLGAGAGSATSTRGPLPAGSYTESCRDMRVDRDRRRLEAECLGRDGRWRDTANHGSRFRCRRCAFRHVISGSLAFVFLTHT
jgi:hypothetical protein